ENLLPPLTTVVTLATSITFSSYSGSASNFGC
ncbi:hypothetical protein CP01DC11_1232B, partial [Chlamydia psittaci 01DC11]